MSRTRYIISNRYWIFKIHQDGENEFIYELESKITNEIYTNEDYHYRILTSSKRGSRYAYLLNANAEYNAKKLLSRTIHMDGEDTLKIEGKFEGTDIKLNQKFI